jgi:ferredoxin
MRVEWDESRCALSALCTGLAPEVFHVDEDGGLTISTGLDDAQREAIQDAADSCPTQAITVAD